MDPSARLYHCARCHHQVIICSHCDRGNIYCTHGCAKTVRRISVRAAGKRYQQTHRGRLMHAARQRRYRLNTQKVTHHGSPEQSPRDLLPASLSAPQTASKPHRKPTETLRCHHCQRECGSLLRRGPLRGYLRPSRSKLTTAHLRPRTRAQGP